MGALAGVPQALLVAPFDKLMVDWHRTREMKLFQRGAYQGIGGIMLKEMVTGAGFFYLYTSVS